MTLSGAADPQPGDKTILPPNVSEQSWFVVPTDKKNSSLMCHRNTSTLTSIVMNTNTMLHNLNIQDRSMQRPDGGDMCNALIHLPGLTQSGITKVPVPQDPIGAITNVTVSNVRLNGASATNNDISHFCDMSPFGLVVLETGVPHKNVVIDSIAQTFADGINGS